MGGVAVIVIPEAVIEAPLAWDSQAHHAIISPAAIFMEIHDVAYVGRRFWDSVSSASLPL